MPGESVTARLIAVLATVLVVMALVGCSEEEPVDTTVPASTTSTSEPAPTFIDATATFTRAVEEETLAAVKLVNADGTIFLFAEDRDSRRVFVWSSEDGSTWTDLGSPFPDGARLDATAASEGLVVAITSGPTSGNPSLWSTTDGIDWSVEEVTIDNENGLMQLTVEALTVTEDTTTLAGFQRVEAEGLIESRIQETLWPEFDRNRHGLNIQPLSDEIKIDVLAPTGLKVISTTATELGLSSQEQEWIRAGMQSITWETWLGLADGIWTPAFVEGAGFLYSMTTIDETTFGVGHTESGADGIWTTTDGIVWDQLSTGSQPSEVKQWSGRLIGTSSVLSAELLISDDGLAWESVGTREYLGRGDNWFIYSFDASQAGVVAGFGGFELGASQGDGVLELPQIEKDGVRVVVQEYGIMRMYEGEGEEIEYVWSSSVDYGPDKLQFDPATGVVHFFRDDGSQLVSLTLDELHALNEMFFSVPGFARPLNRKVMLSSDGVNWTVWDLDDLPVEPQLVSVINSTLIVVGRDPSEQSGFGIWITDIG